jgi:oligoendopeptidase F
MSDTATRQNSASGVRWDFSHLFTSDEAAVHALDGALADCRGFRERYRGRVAELDPQTLAGALGELSALENRLSRIGSYAGLRLSVNVTGEAERDLNATVEQRMVEAQNLLRFFELEWIEVDDAAAERLADDRAVARDRHWLRGLRRFRPHTRSEPEEEMLAEREPAAGSAWGTLFDQVTSTLRVPFEGADRTIDETLSFVRDERRETRIGAYEALFAALEPHLGVQAHVDDTIVGDRLALDRVRDYGGPREARDLANELSPGAVDNLLDSVERHYRLAHRWFRHKARLLAVDRLVLADQYAPLGATRRATWEEATETVAACFATFSPRIEGVARSLYAEGRMDAEPRSGKRGGAFCASVAQDAKPYILMNFTEKLDDIRTLAHELGHGMHFELSGERQTALTHHPPLALAEVPSTFAEMIVFDRLLAEEKDGPTRLALIASAVETSFATVFRQTLMVRYEQRAYGMRTDGKALLPDRLGGFWLDANAPYYGDAVDLPGSYRNGWAYIPHFIHTRFYTYAYVFAHLVSLALYARYREDGDAFVGPYLEFLAAGYSDSPAALLARLGLDIERPDCWDAGFAEMERLISLGERESGS